jgi:hypothetical protein
VFECVWAHVSEYACECACERVSDSISGYKRRYYMILFDKGNICQRIDESMIHSDMMKKHAISSCDITCV